MNRVRAAPRSEPTRTSPPPHEQRRRSRLPGEPEAHLTKALAVPPRRQPHGEEAGVAARLEQPLRAGGDEQRPGGDAEHPLHRERSVREQAARIAPSLLGDRGGAGEAQRDVLGTREPGAELDRGPVVLGSPERDEHRAARPRAAWHEQRHVTRRLCQHGAELRIGHARGQERFGRVRQQEVDGEL